MNFIGCMWHYDHCRPACEERCEASVCVHSQNTECMEGCFPTCPEGTLYRLGLLHCSLFPVLVHRKWLEIDRFEDDKIWANLKRKGKRLYSRSRVLSATKISGNWTGSETGRQTCFRKYHSSRDMGQRNHGSLLYPDIRLLHANAVI